MVEKLRPFINGNYVESKTDKYSDIYDPSTGEVIAQAGDGQGGAGGQACRSRPRKKPP